MTKQVNELITDLEKVQEKAKNILGEYPGISEALTQQLERPLNFLRSKVGLSSKGEAATFLPITKLRNEDYKAGQKLSKKVDLKEVKVAAEINEVNELKAQIDTLEPLFLKIESDKLLDEQPDLVIRGIAKRAGLPITEDTPKKITVKYIDEIKSTILKKQELELKN